MKPSTRYVVKRLARLIIVGLVWVAVMWLLWGFSQDGARRTGWTTYYGILQALQQQNWIEPGSQTQPWRPVEWHVRGPLELGPRFAHTAVCSVALTAGAVILLWSTMPPNQQRDSK